MDYVVYINRIDSYHYPKEHTILYVFRAPGYDSPVPLNWYKQIYIITNILRLLLWVILILIYLAIYILQFYLLSQ